MIPSFVFLVLLILFFAFSIKVLLCLFIYFDAKEHSDNPALWVAVAFLIPDFIGLLLYFIIGRKRVIVCPCCSARMPQGSLYCPLCGHEALAAHEVSGFSHTAKSLLISAVACLALLLLSVAALVIISVSGFLSV